MNPDKYIDEILLKNNILTDNGRELVIDKIIALQVFLKHTTERKSMEELTTYSDKDLVFSLITGYEFITIRYFLNCSIKP